MSTPGLPPQSEPPQSEPPQSGPTQPQPPQAGPSDPAYPPVQYPMPYSAAPYPATGFYPAGQFPTAPYPQASYPYPVSVVPAGYAPVAARPSRLPMIVLSAVVGVLVIALAVTGVLFLKQRGETTRSNQAVADAHAAVDRLNQQIASLTADRDAAQSAAAQSKAAVATCVQDTSDLFNAGDQAALATALQKLRADCRNPA